MALDSLTPDQTVHFGFYEPNILDRLLNCYSLTDQMEKKLAWDE